MSERFIGADPSAICLRYMLSNMTSCRSPMPESNAAGAGWIRRHVWSNESHGEGFHLPAHGVQKLVYSKPPKLIYIINDPLRKTP